MALGYDGRLYVLAFDHRGSFQKKWFGIEGDPTAEETARISDGKRLIFEGLLHAADQGAEEGATGALVDEQFGGDIPQAARERGLKLAMPVEKSGQKTFDFEYGDRFHEHIERFDPDFSKVLVRYNPDGDRDTNQLQLERLKRLSDALREEERRFLFELLVPPEEQHLEQVGGDSDRYDAELRPELMRRAIAEIQDAGIEVDVWKIEGVDSRDDCESLAAQTRAGGREGVACVVLGRGADDAKVDHWLEQAAPVDGFVGFAIGRSIWGDALRDYLSGSADRADAVERIGGNYLRFIQVYERNEVGARP